MMSEDGRSSRRQPSSTRHSSMQRVRPRTKASNASLQSAGRPQETTFTSFEPFSPPNNPNGARNEQTSSNRLSDSASVKSYTSSKRSRSIYAPNRHNSVTEQASDPAHSSYGDGDEQTHSSGVSVASRSLHAVLMDQPEQTRPALFPENMNAYRNNPQSLADLSPSELANFIYREGGAENVIRRLAQDLAERDAEVATLRKKSDKFAFLYKDHLTSVHQMSRLDADKKVQSHFPDPSEKMRTYSEELQEAMADAIDDPFGDQFKVPSVDPTTSAGATETIRPRRSNTVSKGAHSEHGELSSRQQNSLRRRIVANATQGATASAPATAATSPANSTNSSASASASTGTRQSSGLWGMFGGSSRTMKETSNKRGSIANILGMPAPASKSQSLRSPSITEPSAKPPPLEMEQKIDEADLPPPLRTMRHLLVRFPDLTFDNYGFIIDKIRVLAFVQYWTAKNGLPPESYRRILALPAKSADTKSRANSVISMDNNDLDLAESLDTLLDPHSSPVDNYASATSKSWFDYLAFGSTLGLISHMPTQPRPSSSDSHQEFDEDEEPADEADARRFEAVIDPEDYTELAVILRDEISKEYSLLQQDRSKAWSHFLNLMTGGTSNNRLARMLITSNGASAGGNTRNRSNSFSSSSVDIANLAASQFQPQYIKFVLGGIPMNFRSKIWLENAGNSIHYLPEDFERYKAHFPRWISSLAASNPDFDKDSTFNDISSDVLRTLSNNIWFHKARDGNHRSFVAPAQPLLADLLMAFAARNQDIGYIQGFNLIAGHLMLAMPTTEQAFWVFCFLMEKVLPRTYFVDAEFTAPLADTIVIRGFIRQLIPRLSAHMDALELPDDQTVPINWLLTAFASTLSIEALFRVWDVILAIPQQGTYLLRVALTLLKINEEKLLKTDSAAMLYQVMDRHMGAGVSIDGLIHASWILGRTVTVPEVEKRRRTALHRV